jgi:hypothetical protein
LEKNKGTYEEIQKLKLQLQNLEIPDSVFRQKSREIQDRALKDEKTAPTIMIKPTELATYENLVDALDEMLVCNIGAYAIVDLEPGDRYLLFKRTNNPEYLTAEQLLQAQSGKR